VERRSLWSVLWFGLLRRRKCEHVDRRKRSLRVLSSEACQPFTQSSFLVACIMKLSVCLNFCFIVPGENVLVDGAFSKNSTSTCLTLDPI
jgi:hypothetical protein